MPKYIEVGFNHSLLVPVEHAGTLVDILNKCLPLTGWDKHNFSIDPENNVYTAKPFPDIYLEQIKQRKLLESE